MNTVLATGVAQETGCSAYAEHSQKKVSSGGAATDFLGVSCPLREVELSSRQRILAPVVRGIDGRSVRPSSDPLIY
jgi:hypothetical protein